jgi:glycosyltransferase involved in cell wall biosynthesis
MQNIILSIITINLNNLNGLKRTIDSVIEQTNKNFEFIIIDGNSTDGSVELIKENEKEFSYFVSENDLGIYNAMNKGIINSKGEYLLFLNSGDWLNNNNVVENLLPLLKNFDVISGDIDIFDKNKWHSIQSVNLISVSQLKRLSLYHQATFISKKLFDKYGYYNEDFKLSGDYEFFIRVFLKHNASYQHIHLKIANFIADGISNNEKYKQINMQETKNAWALNFSERVLTNFEQNYNFINSPLYWLLKKTENSKIYFNFFLFIHKTRYRIYKLFYK